jgi:hypothetical protein
MQKVKAKTRGQENPLTISQKREENARYFHEDGIRKQFTALEVESVCHFLPLNYLRIHPPEPALTSAPFIANSICPTIFSFLQVSFFYSFENSFLCDS